MSVQIACMCVQAYADLPVILSIGVLSPPTGTYTIVTAVSDCIVRSPIISTGSRISTIGNSITASPSCTHMPVASSHRMPVTGAGALEAPHTGADVCAFAVVSGGVVGGLMKAAVVMGASEVDAAALVLGASVVAAREVIGWIEVSAVVVTGTSAVVSAAVVVGKSVVSATVVVGGEVEVESATVVVGESVVSATVVLTDVVAITSADVVGTGVGELVVVSGGGCVVSLEIEP